MLTIFAIPKPFENKNIISQTNAILSWTQLHPDIEIILFGNETGIKDFANQHNLIHIPEIETNDYGTPLVSSAFQIANQIATNPILFYANADIIFVDDLIPNISKLNFSEYLIAGRRWNIDLNRSIDFNSPEWKEEIKKFTFSTGELFDISGIDYFAFPHSLWTDIPPFAVGRPAWDNWLIFDARQKRIPVIDASFAVTAIHQNHNYNHVKNARNRWLGPEGDQNLALAGGWQNIYTLADATWIFDKGKVKRNINKNNIKRYLSTSLSLHPLTKPFYPSVNNFLSLITSKINKKE